MESNEQVKFLREKKCEFMQGYLFSTPVPPRYFHGDIAGKKSVFQSLRVDFLQLFNPTTSLIFSVLVITVFVISTNGRNLTFDL